MFFLRFGLYKFKEVVGDFERIPTVDCRSPTIKVKGFTLIELSVVIVIIGLIVAGIVAGQALVNQAKLRQVISEINGFKLALNSFKLQYDALPGDMNNAQDYWGSTVDNGNGNGNVDTSEKYDAWEHLSEAELIDQVLSDVPTSSAAIGINMYASDYSNDAGYEISRNTTALYGKRGNRFRIAAKSTSCNSDLNGSLLAVAEAVGIDTKMDDGLADSGAAWALDGTISGNCTPAAECITGTSYNLSNTTTTQCNIFFWIE